jgi:Tfp pilus assembly protein FimV
MKISTRTQATAALTKSACIVAIALSCIVVSPLNAAETEKEAVAKVADANFTVAQSTSVDKLIQKFYANSPLSTSVLRKALVDANPKVITGNPQQRVKAGTVIVVPDHGQIVNHVLTPNVVAKQVILEQNPAASDYQSRKHWVRFP